MSKNSELFEVVKKNKDIFNLGLHKNLNFILVLLFCVDGFNSKEKRIQSRVKMNSDKIEKLENESEKFVKKKEIKNLKKEGEQSNEKYDVKNSQKSTFKQELKKHAEKYDYLKILIMADNDYCEIKGIIFEIQADFIKLLNNENNTMKIPYQKIVAIEDIKNEKQQKSSEDNKKVAIPKAKNSYTAENSSSSVIKKRNLLNLFLTPDTDIHIRFDNFNSFKSLFKNKIPFINSG